MADLIKLKRGTAARWAELNLILEAGEPGFVKDELRLKIGDGVTPWNDLPYIGENDVFNAPTHLDFPSVGRVNVIYKAENEKATYQWNSQALVYELLNVEEIPTYDTIDGGNASG